ncbi:MAG: hypothetical protein GY841_04660 [FCB group bacterium]|nr:hypothetical protein [FCB group bacterium]
MRLFLINLLIFISCGFFSADVLAWDVDEHRRLGDSVFNTVMKEIANFSGDIINFPVTTGGPIGIPKYLCRDRTFGDICALFARDDFRSDRFHDRGRSIAGQLRTLTREQIDSSWNALADKIQSDIPLFAGDSILCPIEFRTQNVISAYLIRHLMAMRLIQMAAKTNCSTALLSDALIMEASAQGYLADAFSSGHMLVPMEDILSPFHGRNNIEAHHYHRHQGVYVLNSRGDQWQTFGDELMHWSSTTYQPVFEACRSSLNEVLAVFYYSSGNSLPDALKRWLPSATAGFQPERAIARWLEHHGGGVYYADLRLPTLLLLPMPISASWSFRTENKDEYDIYRRHHYPQLRETGYHDPDLTDIDIEFLYPMADVPEWMIPKPLRGITPTGPYTLITTHPDWASVRWVQNRYAPPSYKGLLVRSGLQLVSAGNGSHAGGSIGLGYGIWDDLILFQNVSIDAVFMPSLHEAERTVLTITGGGGLTCPLTDRIKAFRFDGGLALGTNSDYGKSGALIALGIDSQVHHLKFTNAGIAFRLKYQWLFLEQTFHGPAMELIFQ